MMVVGGGRWGRVGVSQVPVRQYFNLYRAGYETEIEVSGENAKLPSTAHVVSTSGWI